MAERFRHQSSKLNSRVGLPDSAPKFLRRPSRCSSSIGSKIRPVSIAGDAIGLYPIDSPFDSDTGLHPGLFQWQKARPITVRRLFDSTSRDQQFYCGQVELAHHGSLISFSSRVRFSGPQPWGTSDNGSTDGLQPSSRGSTPRFSTNFAWIAYVWSWRSLRPPQVLARWSNG